MGDLVHRTGGEVIVPANLDSPEQSAEAIRQLSRRVTEDYVLEVELAMSMKKYSTWELKLSGDERKKWKGALISYPAELAPCSP